MKKYLIPFIILVAVSILAYMYNLMTFVLLASIAISLVVLLLAVVVGFFNKNMNPGWKRVPLTVIVIGIVAVAVGLFRPLEPAVISSGSVSERLAYAYQKDQSDRMTLKPYIGFLDDNLAARDNIRIEQAKQFYQDNQISQPLDKSHAAFIFHHSKTVDLFEVAHKLASEAAAVSELKNDYVVQWLAKASYDRWMLALGKPQKFGTQDKFSLSVE